MSQKSQQQSLWLSVVGIFAIFGVPLGRIADSASRKKLLAWGVVIAVHMTTPQARSFLRLAESAMRPRGTPKMAKIPTTESHRLCCWDFCDIARGCYHRRLELWFGTGG